MATDGKNEWDFSSSATLEEGIEKFNITVSGDASQFSSLASLQSTNNTLQTVVVTSAAGSAADLIIGNHNTEGAITNALKDVRDFDSTAFANDVTLNAHVSDEAVAKYMDLKDTAAPAADNANFAYNFGTGADTLNLNISKANLAATGSTTREDFQLDINTSAGNDKVTVQIGDGVGVLTVDNDGVKTGDNWLINSDINRNLNIDTGTGNDTVKLNGAGAWDVTLGTGDDTVYSDNSGKKAVWVFNTADQEAEINPILVSNVTEAENEVETAKDALDPAVPATVTALADAEAALVAAQEALADGYMALPINLDNLQSDNNDTHELYKGTVTVTFKDLASKAITIEGLSSNKYMTDDLHINQAIKKAINDDAVLSKLLVATDGPANTLVVTSLIDGTMESADLAVAFETGTLTPSEIGLLPSGTTVADFEAAVADLNDTTTDSSYSVAALAVDAKGLIEGSNSEQATLNVIEGMTGNNVIVLSTGNDVDDIADTTGSIDTVVYNAAFDTDTIVNFTADEGGDVFDFTALGGSTYGSYGVIVNTAGAINVVTTTTANNTAAAVKALMADDTTANKGVYIAVDEDTNIGTVYQIVDGAAASDLTVTKVGKIDLADTDWSTLTADNFA